MITRIVIHIGLPKAASTSIQVWANTHADELRQRDITFPIVSEVRHQALVKGLMSGDHDWLQNTIMQTESSTMFLSAEGLSWHLQDFSAANLEAFKAILEPYDVSLFLNNRPTKSWLGSFHRQLIVNPVNPQFNYGTALKIEAFSMLPRVRFLLDVDGLLERAKMAYGANNALISTTSGPWAEDLCTLLNVPDLASSLRNFPRRNEGFNADLTELARQTNAMKLSNRGRSLILALLQNEAGSTIDVINAQNKPLEEWPNPAKVEVADALRQLVPENDVQEKIKDRLQKRLLL